jgi:hypothetical protein
MCSSPWHFIERRWRRVADRRFRTKDRRNAITRESYVRDITALLGEKKGIAQRTVDLIAKTSIGFDAAKQAQVEAAVV